MRGVVSAEKSMNRILQRKERIVYFYIPRVECVDTIRRVRTIVGNICRICPKGG